MLCDVAAESLRQARIKSDCLPSSPAAQPVTNDAHRVSRFVGRQTFMDPPERSLWADGGPERRAEVVDSSARGSQQLDCYATSASAGTGPGFHGSGSRGPNRTICSDPHNPQRCRAEDETILQFSQTRLRSNHSYIAHRTSKRRPVLRLQSGGGLPSQSFEFRNQMLECSEILDGCH
jgi:hypothetical protein